jgi:hypothetical protein
VAKLVRGFRVGGYHEAVQSRQAADGQTATPLRGHPPSYVFLEQQRGNGS